MSYDGWADEAWERRCLADLVDDRGVTYGIVQPGKPVADGTPILRVNNFTPTGFRLDNVMRIDHDIAAGFKRSCLRGGEVLITLVGSVGQVAVVPSELRGWNVARAVGVLSISDPLLARWVAWSLQTPAARAYITSRLNTTVQATLNLRDLAAFEVELPPRPVMARIDSVLSSLYDKKLSARRLGDRLGATVQMLFEQQLRGAASTWQSGVLTDVARFVNGKNFTKDASGTGRPVLRIKELNSGLGPSTVYTVRDAASDFVAEHFDLLFAWSGTLGVHRWDGPQSLVNQHIFKVVSHDGYDTWFVEAWLKHHLPSFVSIARDKATTMGHIQRRHLQEAGVRIPDQQIMRRLDETFGPLDALRKAQAREGAKVTAILDALLPKLVSGELTVATDYEPGLLVPA